MQIRTPSRAAVGDAVRSRSELLGLVGFGAVMTALAWLFPRSGDDWAWGSGAGIARLHAHFAGYNGRYLGNLAVLGLTRAPLLAALAVGIALAVILRLMVELGGRRDLAAYCVAVALLLAMPLAQWRQSVVWLSGFTNYALATVALLGFCVSMRRDREGRPTPSVWGCAGLFVFAVAGQLCIEHVTLFITLAAALNLAVLLLRRSVTVRAVIWVSGALVGAAVMFSNSAYRSILAGGTGKRYQGMGAEEAGGTTGIAAAVRQGARGISQLAVAGNVVLDVALLLLVVGLALAARSRAGALTRGQVVAVLSAGAAVVGGTMIAAAVKPGNVYGALSDWSWLAAGLMLVALLLTAHGLVVDQFRRRLVVTLAVSVVVLVAPLAAVTPFGPRNFLPSYVLICALALALLDELRDQVRVPVMAVTVALVSAGLAIAFLAHYVVVYAMIHRASDERLQALRRAVDRGQTQVTLSTLPFTDYVHHGDPLPGRPEARYLVFHHLDPGIHIRLVTR